MPFRGIIDKLSDGKFVLENKQSHLASMMGMNFNMGLSVVLKNEPGSLGKVTTVIAKNN